jgi:hypothetical protein
MKQISAGHPMSTLGLFEKRIDGDDCLMELARLRFEQACMGAEMHAGTPGDLEAGLRFRPSPDLPVVVHLPRNFNIAEEWSRKSIVEFASQFAGRVYGLVLHDHAELASRSEDFRRAAEVLNDRLQTIERCPIVFVEYAAGLEPKTFVSFFRSIQKLPRVSACIDVGHVGIRQARFAYAAEHSGEDICALKTQPAKLQQFINDIQRAVSTGLPTVLQLIEQLGALGKPVHFHLHDGHPLSTFSSFGVSDHLSFLEKIPIAFDFQGRRFVPLMFGPAGLEKIVTAAVKKVGRDGASFTLEIHPTKERLPLDDSISPLFAHWRDKTNAEQVNHWLELLSRNHSLLQEILQNPR